MKQEEAAEAELKTSEARDRVVVEGAYTSRSLADEEVMALGVRGLKNSGRQPSSSERSLNSPLMKRHIYFQTNFETCQ